MEKIGHRLEKKHITEIIKEIFETFNNEKYQFAYKEGVTKNANDPKTKDLKISKKKWSNVGTKMERRIKRFINNFSSKKSLYSANRLLWILSKFVLDLDYVVRVVEPKHEAIQKKRKIWKKLQAEADTALKAYKEEKGDYYKVI